MRKRTAILIGASVLALFHLLVVVVPLMASHASGEHLLGVLVVDLPVVLLLQLLPDRIATSIDSDPSSFALLLCIVGTLMYALVGALIGWFIACIRHRSRPA